VERDLHAGGERIAVGEDVGQVLRAQHVPERRLRQQTRRVVRVLHVGHRYGRVANAVVDHGVHAHRHRILGQDLNDISAVTSHFFFLQTNIEIEYLLL